MLFQRLSRRVWRRIEWRGKVASVCYSFTPVEVSQVPGFIISKFHDATCKKYVSRFRSSSVPSFPRGDARRRKTLLSRGCEGGEGDREVVRYEISGRNAGEIARRQRGGKVRRNGTTNSNIGVWLICVLGAKIIKPRSLASQRLPPILAKGVSRI